VLGASALGLYGRAYELMMVPAQALGVVLDKILFATMSQMQDESLRLTRAYRRAAALVALLVLPVSAATIVLAPEIIRALLGSGWEGAVRPLQVLGVAMYFRSGSMVGNSLANASGAVGRSAARTALYAVSVVVGAWIGSRWGLVGVASGVVGAVVLNFVVVFHLVHRLTGLPIREFLGVHVPALGLAAVIGVEAYGVRTVVGGTGNAAVLVLAAFAVLAATTVVLLVRLLPRSALGDEGTWMVHMVCANAPAPVQPYLRKALAVPA
jgi:PST family polysaccharide transporter